VGLTAAGLCLPMTREETFGQLLGLGKAWRVLEARLEASSSTFVLKVKETAALWPEEIDRAVTLMLEMPVKRAGQILGESDTRM
jgi:hypothetical protein